MGNMVRELPSLDLALVVPSNLLLSVCRISSYSALLDIILDLSISLLESFCLLLGD